MAVMCVSIVAACGRVRFGGALGHDAAVGDVRGNARGDGGFIGNGAADGGASDTGSMDASAGDGGGLDALSPPTDAAPQGAASDTRDDVVRYGAPVEYDFATGLLANLPPLGTTGADGGVAQNFASGWTYRVRARTEFGFYGNLVAGGNVASAIVMPLGWNTTGMRGWGCSGTAAASVRGQRGVIMLGSWALRRVAQRADPVDALAVFPENSCQPVLEWTPPRRGRVEIHVEIIVDPCTRGPMGSGGDVEWHVVAGRPGMFTQYGPARYIGCDDQNGRATTPAPITAPATLDFTEIPLEVGDVIFLAARVGDHDGGDGTLARGRIVFEPRE